MNDQIIIIKVNGYIKSENYEKLRKMLFNQLENGLILVPHFCDVVVIPKDVDVKFEPQEDGFYAEN